MILENYQRFSRILEDSEEFSGILKDSQECSGIPWDAQMLRRHSDAQDSHWILAKRLLLSKRRRTRRRKVIPRVLALCARPTINEFHDT